MQFAVKHHLYVVEDNAQAIECYIYFSDGTKKHTGTIGHIGCTSFFPSKIWAVMVMEEQSLPMMMYWPNSFV